MSDKNPQVAKRIAICKSCPELTVIKTCKKCACFMPAKVRIISASCPMLKWLPAEKP